MGRKGDWIQTYSGKQFWPLDPRPEDFDINDIAHALANTCRYSGHSVCFYSVAEHSVAVASRASADVALEALMHDAAEAYLADVPRPVKPFLEGYKEIEERIERALAERYGLQYPWPQEVHDLDCSILANEKMQLMTTEPASWRLTHPPLDDMWLSMWPPHVAKATFLQRFLELARERLPERVGS